MSGIKQQPCRLLFVLITVITADHTADQPTHGGPDNGDRHDHVELHVELQGIGRFATSHASSLRCL